jgi:hypothetical protein
MDRLEADQVVASASKFLLEGDDEQGLRVLLACRVDDFYTDNIGSGIQEVHIHLCGPRPAYEAIVDWRTQWESDLGARVARAFVATLPHGYVLGNLDIRAERVELYPEWREGLVARALGLSIDNQAVGADKVTAWNNLRFRSVTEVKIAEALDRAGVMFFPLCKGRVTKGKFRVNREPDFLVCYQGKWGILEVDGEPWHPPSRTVEDHERDRLFREHGVKIVEHFDAKQCYNVPDLVVKRFLALVIQA